MNNSKINSCRTNKYIINRCRINKSVFKRKINCILAVSLVLSMLFSLFIMDNNTVYADNEAVNPFSLTVTDADSSGYFTVNVNVSKDCVVEAYKIVVNYDVAKAVVADGSYGMRYYSSFINKYNANSKALYAANHLSANNQIVFAGAQPQKDYAKLSAGDRVCYVTFKCADSQNVTYEDVIASISANVVNCSDGEKDIVKENPTAFADALIPETGDDLRGEKCLLGDADDSGKVDLKDAKIVLTVSLGIITVDADKMEAADVDFDGKVTLKDAKLVLKYSLGIINTFE